MSREEKINKMIEEIKIRRNDEQYRGGPFPIYHIEFDILNEEIERLNNIINDLLNRQNEALRYIGNHLSLDSRYKHGNGDKELTLVKNILNKHIKELKGVDKE